MLTSSGTPSSGLVSWAWTLWTPFLRNNNRLSSLIPLPPFYPKPVFCFSSKNNSTSSDVTPISGSPSFGPTANPLPSFKVPSHTKTVAPSLPQFNSPSTTHSRALTPRSFAQMLAIISGAHVMVPLHPLPLHHLFRNKLVSNALWQFNM